MYRCLRGRLRFRTAGCVRGHPQRFIAPSMRALAVKVSRSSTRAAMTSLDTLNTFALLRFPKRRRQIRPYRCPKQALCRRSSPAGAFAPRPVGIGNVHLRRRRPDPVHEHDALRSRTGRRAEQPKISRTTAVRQLRFLGAAENRSCNSMLDTSCVGVRTDPDDNRS